MQELSWIAAAIFLPLFPFGMFFNALLQRVQHIGLRIAMLTVWPVVGVTMLAVMESDMPGWVVYWALFSALLYSFRALVVKEFGIWIGFIATSAWSLLWVAAISGVEINDLFIHALASALPLSLLAVLVSEVEKRHESSYAGVVKGLAQLHPRLSCLLVLATLAVIGSPLFPAFFSMLDTIVHASAVYPVSMSGVLLVWLLWSWSGIKILQDLLVGSAERVAHADITNGHMLAYGISIVALVISGPYLSGVML